MRSATQLGASAITAAVLVPVSLWSLAGGRAESIDDAFILLVYVRHWLAGSAEWNVGDGAVEGFTSTLHLLATALVSMVEHDLVRADFLVTIGSAVGSAWACAAIAGRLADARRPRGVAGPNGAEPPRAIAVRTLAALVGGGLVASSPDLADASAYLLETPLVLLVALSAVATVALARESATTKITLAVAALLCTLALSRPEAALAALALALIWARGDGASAAISRTTRWLPLAATTTLLGAHLAFRWGVFGELAPNTFYAKSSASRWLEMEDGLRYVGAFATRPAGVLLIGALVGGAVLVPRGSERWFERAEHRERALVCWVTSALWVGAVVVGGGDCYAGGRFLVVPAALAMVGLGFAWAGLRRTPSAYVGGALIALLALQLSGLASGADARLLRLSEWPPSDASYGCDRELVRVVTGAWPDAVVAQSDFQRFKYFSDRTRVLDLHGLNDRALAHVVVDGPVRHGKYDPSRAARTDADVWIWGYLYWQERPLAEHSLAEVLADPGLAQQFSGYPERPDAEARARMLARFTTASVPACGGYYNFLVRQDLPVPSRPDLRVHGEAIVPSTGRCVDVGTPAARAWLFDGWSGDENDAERTFVWSDASATEIRWGSLVPGPRYRIVLYASGITTPSGPPIHVDATVEGATVGSFDLPVGWAEHTLELPEGAQGVRLAFDRTVSPGADTRELALQLDRICVAPRE